MLIAKNEEREDEFHNYIEGVAKKNWDINDNNGPLEYLWKYSLNYPNKSYMISKIINEPVIDIYMIFCYLALEIALFMTMKTQSYVMILRLAEHKWYRVCFLL